MLSVAVEAIQASRMTSKRKKGSVLEDLVAMLHGVPGVTVEKRIKLRSIRPNSKRVREIDVLLTSRVAGYPVRIAIECKNFQSPVKSHQVDKFLSVLADVGVPNANGIIVSSSGYRSDALELAREAGVRALIFEGLNTEQLGLEVNSAIQSVIFHVATWDTMCRFSRISPVAEFPAPITVVDFPEELGEGTPAILTLLYLLWQQNHVPSLLGTHHLAIRLPKSFRLSREEEPTIDALVMLVYRVEGFVGTIEGRASAALLRNAADLSLEKLRVDAGFDATDEPLELRRFESEEELGRFLAGQANVRLVTRVKVPRIASEWSFWPPSRWAAEEIKRRRQEGEEPTFEEIEGVSLNRAWDTSVYDKEE